MNASALNNFMRVAWTEMRVPVEQLQAKTEAAKKGRLKHEQTEPSVDNEAVYRYWNHPTESDVQDLIKSVVQRKSTAAERGLSSTVAFEVPLFAFENRITGEHNSNIAIPCALAFNELMANKSRGRAARVRDTHGIWPIAPVLLQSFLNLHCEERPPEDDYHVRLGEAIGPSGNADRITVEISW